VTSPDAPSPGIGAAGLANALTLLRVALVPVIAYLLWLDDPTARWWAFGIFAFAALTDSIDGWVARRLVGVTRWGQLADPIADKLLIIGSLAALAWLGELPWWAVAVIVAREVAVTVQRVVLVNRGVVMPASIFGKAKTVSQVIAVTLFLIPAVPEPVALGGLWVAVLLTVASGLEYALRGKRLVGAR
jgi:CDP-diacylglycerol---glycerol-3-phosphate 3-phosphatidyltransferase